MNCLSCGAGLKDEWRFCPACGYKKREGLFDSIFSRFRREMAQMDRSMEKDFESFDVSDLMKSGARGFTIRISTGDGMEPKVEVSSTGDVDNKEIERHLKEMGVQTQQRTGKMKVNPAKAAEKMPEKTEEPETRVIRSGNGVKIEMELPDVREKDIRIQEFESSVEVRAFGKDKAFFKIVTKPENASVRRRGFADGKLVLEVG